MNRCGYHQNAVATCEEMSVESVVCPKPRRLGILNPSLEDHIKPLRCHISHQTDTSDSKAGTELMDIILTKGGYSPENYGSQVASPQPFFCGSPPSRAPNPVIHDAQFGNEKIFTPLSPSGGRRGGIWMKLGHKPAAVRIEGFDCLSRDRRNCSISAVA